MIFDLKFKDFLAKHQDITMVGMAWSCYWRLAVLIWGIVLVIAMIGKVLE